MQLFGSWALPLVSIFLNPAKLLMHFNLNNMSRYLAAITNTAVPGGSSPTDSPKQFAVTVATLWQTIILVGGLAFILFFLWGGLEWIMAGGDKGKLEAAKGK